ncbi:TonB family protein [Nitrospirillum sp. BR 11828]|uniref:energy transducer TonB n=1 Tax=Nitrospirillum sp. BR 11828 TaxID=3104325 RepID=UPI002ACA8118|nr:TonB family protein [Nitrospirillum sp. BR 11828]MDZ5646262.1 TonB family protein [Nitrospirillum sp. BR 11828]
MRSKIAPTRTAPGVMAGFRSAAYGRAVHPRAGAVFAALIALAIQAALVTWMAGLSAPATAAARAQGETVVVAQLLPPPPRVVETPPIQPHRQPPPSHPRQRSPAPVMSQPAPAPPVVATPLPVPPAPPPQAATADTPPPTTIQRAPDPPPPDVLEAYTRAVWQALARHRPAHVAAAGTVVLAISVVADGQVRDAAILTSSGSSVLDDIALRAVSQAAPLPPPPEALLTDGRFSFTVPFRFR